MPLDFTPQVYRQLLFALQQAGYTFITFEKWCEKGATDKFVVLRHDVDLKAERSLEIAKIESEMGVVASYYFRVVPQSNQPSIITEIARLGHEIGYHYEDLSLFKGNIAKALIHFETQLAYFRQFYPVKTICMHGSPTSKFDNRHLWNSKNYKDYGIVGEPYFDFLSSTSNVDGDIAYFTDTARMWDGDKYNVRDKSIENKRSKTDTSNRSLIHTSFDFIAYISTNTTEKGMMITTHPQRWTDNKIEWCKELILQNVKNLIKKYFFI